MNCSPVAIDEFWQWFQAHRSDFDALVDTAAPFWDVALGRLQGLNKHLWFELSRPDDGPREFILTTEGHKEAFPLADAIVRRAPEIPGWQFISLKPPQGFDFEFTYEGIPFNPRDMWFLPLENRRRPQDLGLRVGVPNFESSNARQANNAVLVILDCGLGERDAAVEIQFVDVTALPADPEAAGFLKLAELPSYITWRRRKLRDT